MTRGFSEVESLPTLVRYQKRDIEVRVYHGRRSFELGFELDRDGAGFSLAELIRLTDKEAADGNRNYAATTPERIRAGVALLADLVQKYAERALRGEADVFEKLKRQDNYRQAAELYEQTRPQLSPVELKKLSLAKRRL